MQPKYKQFRKELAAAPTPEAKTEVVIKYSYQREDGRKRLSFDNYTSNSARVIWNIWNPSRPVKYRDLEYIVHHVDGDPTNDHPDNLQRMRQAVHARHHQNGKQVSPETIQKLRKAHKGHPVSMATRRKISISKMGTKLNQWNQDKAVQLRLEGHSFRQIGNELGVNEATVRCYLKKYHPDVKPMSL